MRNTAIATVEVRLEAKDNASEVVKKAGKEIETAGDKAEAASKRIETSGQRANGSSLEFAKGLAGVTTSAVALYGSFDRLEQGQLAVDRANLLVKQTTSQVELAQRNLSKAIAEYGPDSEEASLAAEKLALAQERLGVVTQSAQQKQGDLNRSYLELGVTILPATINAVDDLGKMWKSLGPSADAAKGIMGGLNTSLAEHRMAWVSAGLGAGALMTAMMAFGAKSEEEKVALSLLTGGLVAAAAAQWIWNTATAFGLGLTGAGLALVGTAAAAAAATYILASQYGSSSQGGGSTDAQGHSGGLGTRQITRSMGSNGAEEVVGYTETSTGMQLTDKFYDESRGWMFRGSGDASGIAADQRGALYTNNGGTWTPVTAMAEGGIVTRPTLALIGEAGPEQVIPLRGRRSSEQFTVNVHFHAPVYNGADIPRLVQQAVRDEMSGQRRRY